MEDAAQFDLLSDPMELYEHGCSMMRRHLESGSLQHLLAAVECFQRAAESHPDRAACLDLLGEARVLLFQSHRDDPSIIDSAISAHMSAITLTPDRHPDKPIRLSHFANALRCRYDFSGESEDMQDYIITLRSAIDLAPASHPSRLLLFRDLGNALEEHFSELSALAVVETAVTLFQRAVDETQDGDPVKPCWHANLGTALLNRFELLRDREDVEDAVKCLRHAVSSTDVGHSERSSRSYKLASALLYRLANGEHPSDSDIDTEDAVVAMYVACDGTLDSHPGKPKYLDGLVTALRARFKRWGSTDDYENIRVTQHFSAALKFTQSPHHPSSVRVLRAYSQPRWDELEDLEEITELREVFLLLHDDYPDKQARLSKLRELEARARSVLKQTASLPGENGYTRYLKIMDRLQHLSPYPTISLQHDFERVIPSATLERTLVALSRGISTGIPGDCDSRGSALPTLGTVSDDSNAQRFSPFKDKWEWTRTIRRVIVSTSDYDVDKRALLGHLRRALLIHSEDFDGSDSGNAAIATAREAVRRTQDEDEDLLYRLDDLGRAIHLRVRLGQLAVRSDQDEGTQRDEFADRLSMPALELLDDHAEALFTRFEELGVLKDLDVAVDAFRGADELTPDGHPKWAIRQDRHALALKRRYELLRNVSDLDRAAVASRRTVRVTPDGHPRKVWRLFNLGTILRSRFEELRLARDIEDAIQALKSAVDSVPDDHPMKVPCINALGYAYNVSFQYLPGKNPQDIKNAVSSLRRALELNIDDSLTTAPPLNNLGAAYHLRFESSDNLEDLDEAIRYMRPATSLALDGGPDSLTYLDNLTSLNSLGYFLTLRFERLGHQADFDEALEALTDVSNSALNPATCHVILDSARNCAQLCHGHPIVDGTNRLIEAYKRVVSTIPHVAWRGHDVSRRFAELTDIGGLVNAAVAAAVETGHTLLAVEWFEEGRSIVWRQALQLRAPRDELRARYPELEERLQAVAVSLEKISEEDGAQEYRALVVEYEELVNVIRQMDGFSTFLLQKTASELAPAAETSPVIMLNVHESRCDALVLWSSGEVSHVPLPLLSSALVRSLRTKFVGSLRGARSRSNRAFRSNVDSNQNMLRILKILWSHIVQPVLCAIEEDLWNLCTDYIPHITWCTTGPLAFLPLHAAGIYDSPGGSRTIRATDFIMSSYTPSLTALSHLRKSTSTTSLPSARNILVVTQPDTPGLNAPLACTLAEKDAIEHHFPEAVTALNDTKATVEAVEEKLGLYTWVHLACHGSQDLKNPTRSAFYLYDGKLALSQIMAKSFDHAELAVLSACETATGDAELPEEAVHLAAGMLAAGYKSVIATMWPIADEDGPVVADTLYAELRAQIVAREPLAVLHEVDAFYPSRQIEWSTRWSHIGMRMAKSLDDFRKDAGHRERFSRVPSCGYRIRYNW